MIPNPQPGNHLDADELSMFVDGQATPHERERIIAHLGQCQECRSVVFLMQGQAEPEPSQSESGRRWPWRGWIVPAGLAGAVLACSLLLAVYLRTHRVKEIATHNSPMQAPLDHGKRADVASRPESQSTTSPQKNELAGNATAPHARQPRVGNLADETPADAPKPSPSTIQNQLLSSEAVDRLAQKKKSENLPTTNAALSQLQPQPEVASVPNEAKDKESLGAVLAAKSLPMLKIEKDRGPEDGSSEVSGRITDQTGAVIAGAEIALRDAQGKTKQTTSSGDGTFTLAGVEPGHYDLRVAARGFQTSQTTLDLKSRDLAKLDSVLTVGASTETVEVQAQSFALNTESASVASDQIATELPSRLPATARVQLGRRVLSLDNAGALFVSRNAGKSWKRVKPQWTGKVSQISTSASEPEDALSKQESRQSRTEVAPATFQLTTETGAVWTSNDGVHWRAQ